MIGLACEEGTISLPAPAPPSTVSATEERTLTAPLVASVGSSRYRVLLELGRGGMATAFLAAQAGPAGFRKLVVVKQLHPDLALEPELLQMFLDEARLAARIDHPNVVHTYEVSVEGDRPFIAMEYIEGQSLEGIARRARAASEPRAAFPLNLHLLVLRQILEGLHFAHELKDFDGSPLGIVHRDISPHNVMVSYEGHAVLVDFGIAKAKSTTSHTATGSIKGKSAYMAPEQFEGRGVDRRADVFAVGVMFWQALTGQRLFAGRSDADIQRAVSTGVPKPSSVVPDVPGDLEAVCMKALAPRREDRHASAAEFLLALEACIDADRSRRATSRELATHLQATFGDARAKVRRAVEEALAKPSTPEPAKPPATPARSGLLRSPFVVYGVGALFAGLAFVGGRLVRSSDAPRTDLSEQALLLVRSSPDARVLVDGAALVGSPAEGTFRRDGSRHLVRVEAPGHEPYSEWLTLSAARIVMDVGLRRAAEPKETLSAALTATAAVAQPPASAVAVAVGRTIAGSNIGPKTPRVGAASATPVASTAPASSAPAAAPPRTGIQVDLDKDNPFKRGTP